MITFIHGDNQVDSRQKLSELVKHAHDKEIVRLGEISLTDVKQALEATSLFSQDKLVVIENLLGGKKKNNDVWEYLKKGEYDCDLVLWESKKMHCLFRYFSLK